MKTTRIVRRIDDLGRVVIPKEIRRALRFRDGDPLEMFVERDGVLLKKYSPIGEFGDFAKKYADSLNETMGYISMIADRDVIIAVVGTDKAKYFNKAIGKMAEKSIEERATLIMNEIDAMDESQHVVQFNDLYDIKSQVIAPIICQGDPVGAVILASKEPSIKMGEMEVKLAETAATFLAKQYE